MELFRNKSTDKLAVRKDIPIDEHHAFLGKSVFFNGQFRFSGTAQIDSRFQGDITSEGRLIVGLNGDIVGKVEVKHLVCGGKIDGDLLVSGKLQLLETAYVTGNITAGVLEMVPGAKLIGKIKTSKNSLQEKRQEVKDIEEEKIEIIDI